MERAYLQWNIVNWITVLLMATLGMMLVGAASSLVRQYAPNSPLSGN